MFSELSHHFLELETTVMQGSYPSCRGWTGWWMVFGRGCERIKERARVTKFQKGRRPSEGTYLDGDGAPQWWNENCITRTVVKLLYSYNFYLLLILFSKLESLTQELMKRDKFHKWRVPKNAPVNDPKAVEQTSPPRCAMQGPICGGPPSWSQPPKQGKYEEEKKKERKGGREERYLYPRGKGASQARGQVTRQKQDMFGSFA